MSCSLGPLVPRPLSPGSSRWIALVGLAAIVVLFGGYRILWHDPRQPLVVYCAHDAVYADAILKKFADQTGIRVAPRYDAEATKSLGLVERLIREKSRPQCDVFWNNESLGTMDLAERGLLEPYKGEGYARIPAQFKAPDGQWAGFGARLRVYIVNTQQMAATADSVALATAGNLSRCAIAKPLYGTTLTHYAVLWHLWGADKLKAWHRDWRARGVIEVGGNGPVKDLVAQGTCDLGLTDTDDFFVAKDRDRPVDLLPFRTDTGQVICIPNTVAIIKGTRRLTDAQRLADYLLSEECEITLAQSKSRQIPLGAVDENQLPEEVRQLAQWARDAYPLAPVLKARNACLVWLKTEYVR